MRYISFSFAYRILNYANSRGIDTETLLCNSGVGFSDLNRFDLKISIDTYLQILEEAVRLSGDPCFGLHMGEFFEWEDLSDLGHIMNIGFIMSSGRTIGEAIVKACNYLSLVDAPYDSQMVVDDTHAFVMFIPKYLEKSPMTHCMDEALSSLYKIVRSIARKPITLKEVRFSCSAPADTAEYERAFSCPVYFNREHTSLVLNPQDLEIPIVSVNLKFPSRVAVSSLRTDESLVGLREYSNKISALLFNQLQKGPPCIKQVAKDLGMSVRCLQLKLSQEGETFSSIVKNLRVELAKNYLLEKNHSIDEISGLLGFSDPSVFYRAFKNWTGRTPSTYRDVT